MIGSQKFARSALVAIIVASIAMTALSTTARAASRSADLNNDGQTNISDLSILLAGWGAANLAADIDGNGRVDVLDLSILLSAWGKVPDVNPIPITTPVPASADPTAGAGAELPISYPLAEIPAGSLYVAPGGSDAAPGTVTAPLASLAGAIKQAAAGATIIIRGGTYRESGLYLGKTVKIMAYPGEVPTFTGAAPAAGGWTTAGTVASRPYTPIPVADGSGISFSSCQNQPATPCVGKYADQAWNGAVPLRQVLSQGAVTDTTFYVDTASNRLYVGASVAATGKVEVSSLRTFIKIGAPDVTLKGLRITRYSNNASDYGVVFVGKADRSLIDSVEIDQSAFNAITYDQSLNARLTNSTVTGSNWMGIAANGTTNLTIDRSRLTGMNAWDEFTNGPQSGALKTSRTSGTTVTRSVIRDNHNMGLWFDQSNNHTTVAANLIDNNIGAGLFYEISNDLYAVNNYIRTAPGVGEAVRLAASSNVSLVNNTIVGGAVSVLIGVDARSIPGCADPSKPLCADSYNSDRDTFRPYDPALTWLPSMNLMLNNVIVLPIAGRSSWCSAQVQVCVQREYKGGTASLQSIFHGADAARGIAATRLDGNVYAGPATRIQVKTNTGSSVYGSLPEFINLLAASPVALPGMESAGLSGPSLVNADGSPTATLSARHGQAASVPAGETRISTYVPVGTRHYGVLWR